VSIHKVVSEEDLQVIADVVITDPEVISGREDQMVILKEDSKFTLNSGYRDTLAALPKMEDFSHDLTNCKAVKIESTPRLEVKKQEFDMLYRKIVANRAEKTNFVTTVLIKDIDSALTKDT